MLSLVQITVGEGWHEIMYVIMNGKHSFYWSIYFMLYVLVETLMMTNLLYDQPGVGPTWPQAPSLTFDPRPNSCWFTSDGWNCGPTFELALVLY